MKFKLILQLFLLLIFFSKLSAQNDTMAELRIGNTLKLIFPFPHSDSKTDLRESMEGRNNGIIYSLFISDEFSMARIQNGLQLDSLYQVIEGNTLAIYSNDVVEHNSYYEKFGALRAKYVYVKSTDLASPYVAEYYIVCVSGRMYIMSTTYLSSFSPEQIKEVKNFKNSIYFDEKLGYVDQLNRF